MQVASVMILLDVNLLPYLQCDFGNRSTDNPGKNVQQVLISNESGRELSDPATWGVLTLVKAFK
jgi:hypothetical protein